MEDVNWILKHITICGLRKLYCSDWLILNYKWVPFCPFGNQIFTCSLLPSLFISNKVRDKNCFVAVLLIKILKNYILLLILISMYSADVVVTADKITQDTRQLELAAPCPLTAQLLLLKNFLSSLRTGPVRLGKVRTIKIFSSDQGS